MHFFVHLFSLRNVLDYTLFGQDMLEHHMQFGITTPRAKYQLAMARNLNRHRGEHVQVGSGACCVEKAKHVSLGHCVVSPLRLQPPLNPLSRPRRTVLDLATHIEIQLKQKICDLGELSESLTFIICWFVRPN